MAETGIGELVNDIDADPRRVTSQTALKALLCAPMKVGERAIGVIALGSTVPMAYTAAELKLLNTLALQTATAIENARLFERTIQAAQERERLLALHQAAELARAKLEGEMKLAARIQAGLVSGEPAAARRLPACGAQPPGAALWRRLLRRADAGRVSGGRPAAVRRRRIGQGPAGGAA